MGDWMPIKLASVISSIDSDLGDSVHDLPEAFEIPDSDQSNKQQSQIQLRPRLEKFIEDLQDKADLDIEQGPVGDVVDTTLQDTGKTTTRLEGIEDALDQLEQEIDDRGYTYELSRTERSDLIDKILASNFDDLHPEEKDDEWYLEVSFTAIYW
ncbi:hypothetical protein LPA46_16640 [Halobacterium sp. KA-6]|nr:hypothetical protein [Halobacterium sp. KA-6]MCD2204956.1 hypothetical protein [Halobacterium sp. KA-6]